jgi:hypothetical protein
MAGFDFLAEVSNETVLKLIEQNLKIGGVSASPPFELTLPLAGGGVNGTAHLIVTGMTLDLNANDTITLKLAFDRASVVISAPLPLALCPLDGNFTITAALQLVDAGNSNKQLSVNLGAATVALNWSAAASQEIAADLAGAPINAAGFTTLANQMLTGYVQSIAAPTIPIAFSVKANENGSLSPNLRFEQLEVHCIHNAQAKKQALGFFGILLKANHGKGDHTKKTSTAITAAHDGVCISISPGAFHSLIFCPAIASALSTDVSHLPGSCGAADGYETQGVSVDSISDSFGNGKIDINGAVSKSGFCYDAEGTFHGAITFTISGTTLTPHLAMDDPDVDVDIPWYCYLAVGVVLGPIGLVLAGVVDGVADGIATSLAGDALKNALGSGIPGVGVGGLSGASFTSVTVTTEGITLQGTVPVYISHPYVPQELTLSGSVITTHSEVLSSGIFHTQVWCMPNAKDYPYTEYSQQQKGVYSLAGTMVVQPLTPQFAIQAGGTSTPLTGSSGTVALANVNTHYPMPLATGGTAMQQTVHVGYKIAGTSIELTNVPSEGDYAFILTATATDCDGNPVQNDANYTLNTSINVQFEGDHVEIGGGYAADVQYCGHLLSDFMKKILDEYKQWQEVPIWQQVNYPAPDDMIRYIRDVMALGVPEADEILLTSKVAHGNSFYRALLSPAAKQPGLLKAKSVAAGKREIAGIVDGMTSLVQQLANAGGVAAATQAGSAVAAQAARKGGK